MRLKVNPQGFNLWLSARDTEAWATRPRKRWPCSQLRGKRLFVGYDSCGLVDLTINGNHSVDCDTTELNAIVVDHVSGRIPQDHPAHYFSRKEGG